MRWRVKEMEDGGKDNEEEKRLQRIKRLGRW